MYNLNRIIVTIFNYTRAYIRGYTLVLTMKNSYLH